jgi:hypothetical protein
MDVSDWETGRPRRGRKNLRHVTQMTLYFAHQFTRLSCSPIRSRPVPFWPRYKHQARVHVSTERLLRPALYHDGELAAAIRDSSADHYSLEFLRARDTTGTVPVLFLIVLLGLLGMCSHGEAACSHGEAARCEDGAPPVDMRHNAAQTTADGHPLDARYTAFALDASSSRMRPAPSLLSVLYRQTAVLWKLMHISQPRLYCDPPRSVMF